MVLGMARQGRALGRWLPTIGARVTLTDARPAEKLTDAIREFADHDAVQIVPGGHPLSLLDDCDLLCVSGGVPLTIPIIQAAYERGIRVANDAQLFLERCPAPVLGITGSAGKTTTTALVGAMCRHWTDSDSPQRHTFVGGNIGDVLLDVLPQIAPEDRVVMELSSFQLELITASPPIAAVLNLTPNHLDRHGTMDAYRAAKANIYAHQSPDQIAVFGWDDPNARRMSAEAPGRVAYFSRHERVDSGAFLDGANLVVIGASAPDCDPASDPVIVCLRESVHLRGDHNVLNVLAACAIAGAGGIPPESMRAAIESFHGVAHRMETIATIGGVTWVNDSIATAPERVSAALTSYNEPIVLLAGGRDKDLPWEDMIALAVQKCRAVIAFGEYAPQIAGHMQRAQADQPDQSRDVRVITVPGLPEAVHAAHEIAQPGDVVLLSPGGTSYDAYQDFAARGLHFRDLVQAYFGESRREKRNMQWLNEPTRWTHDGDTITVTADGKTDFWRITHDGGVRDTGHFYYQSASGDFVANVTFSAKYSALYDHAGLMLRLDETTWLKCGIELFNGIQHASVVVTRDFSDWSVVPLPDAPPALWLRLTRHAESVEVAYSVDGAAYVMLRQAYLTPAAVVQVGVMCCAPTGDGFTATFEGFRVESA